MNHGSSFKSPIQHLTKDEEDRRAFLAAKKYREAVRQVQSENAMALLILAWKEKYALDPSTEDLQRYLYFNQDVRVAVLDGNLDFDYTIKEENDG